MISRNYWERTVLKDSSVGAKYKLNLCQTIMRHMGFTYLGEGTYSFVMSKPNSGYVIKFSEYSYSKKKMNNILDKFVLPYIRVYRMSGVHIAIQKKIDMTNLDIALEKIIERSGMSKFQLDVDFDVRESNIGWLRGKPVIFDYQIN